MRSVVMVKIARKTATMALRGSIGTSYLCVEGRKPQYTGTGAIPGI